MSMLLRMNFYSWCHFRQSEEVSLKVRCFLICMGGGHKKFLASTFPHQMNCGTFPLLRARIVLRVVLELRIFLFYSFTLSGVLGSWMNKNSSWLWPFHVDTTCSRPYMQQHIWARAFVLISFRHCGTKTSFSIEEKEDYNLLSVFRQCRLGKSCAALQLAQNSPWMGCKINKWDLYMSKNKDAVYQRKSKQSLIHNVFV